LHLREVGRTAARTGNGGLVWDLVTGCEREFEFA
jgi:hypothetical protein